MNTDSNPSSSAELNPLYRLASADDIDALLTIEIACFENDRLSRRSFRHWIQVSHGDLLVCEVQGKLLGYGLLWCHQGTRLARLYSLAVLGEARGQGIADALLQKLEAIAVENNRIYMRLEVSERNQSAIRLYERHDYLIFGEYCDYYQDHSDALRMQKRIMRISQDQIIRTTPWYQQTTDFTCGPAALLMAMASLDNKLQLSQELELEIWREATTIFMTSGHGGCHPVGLAIAAHRRGFAAQVYINSDRILFTEGVRSTQKRKIIEVVQRQFESTAQSLNIAIHRKEIDQDFLQESLSRGYAVVILISTYRLDGKKAPHWVCVTAIDERCIYVHDPDTGTQSQIPIDCQYLPIAREDFKKMSAFGSRRLRTAVLIKRPD